MRELLAFRRAGSGALRRLADMFTDDRHPPHHADQSVDAVIVFADIENFSDMVAREGDDVASQVLDALDAAVEESITGTTSRLVKRLGDGVMITSDDPGDGVSTAVALPARFAANLEHQPFSLRLRVGAHMGEVRRRGDDLIGYHVNVAARVAEQATGGVTLITGDLHDAVVLSQRLQIRPMGPLVAKGVPERPRLYELMAEAADTAA
jgi:adenylate cyclase